MKDICSSIAARKSVRSYSSRSLSAEQLEQLCAFAAKIENPYGLPVEFRLLEDMSCPVVVGTGLYIGGKLRAAPYMNEAFGYSFETLVLYARSQGIGTVWIGGTMDRAAFESKMELKEEEFMPCVSPLGHPAEKMSLRETLMRKSIKADERIAFEQLFFSDSFQQPLTADAAGRLFTPLEMVRLGPSAVNRQPWRAVVKDSGVHFYLRRAKAFGGGAIDMQKIDMGISLCHFSLSAQELGLELSFSTLAPDIEAPAGMEYIASYILK